MKLTKVLFITLFFSGIWLCVAQQKFEREYRLKPEKAPEKARHFIKKCAFKNRIKWFAEESQDGKTIEAKTIKDKHKFSIEFDLDGAVIDVEKTVGIDELSSETRRTIEEALANRFKKYKLKKVQVQWKGSESELIQEILNSNSTLGAEFFEIVLKAKSEKAFYEVLIAANGKILKELKFVPRTYDNLEY